jgi:3-oxoacyl-[acyl-carrier protein] reductase
MDVGIRGRVALVTGGSRGLGRSEAEALAQEGAAVVIVTAKSIREAEQVVQGIRRSGGHAVAVQADVTVASEVRRAVEYTVETFGRLDILVNNAGITRKEMCGPLLDLTEEG